MKRNRLLANGLMRLVACALTALVSVGAGEAWGQNMIYSAPLNPRYVKWKKESAVTHEATSKTDVMKRSLRLQNSGDIGYESDVGVPNYGIVPDAIDLSYIARLNSRVVRGVQDDLPVRYDSRDKRYITSIKNQNPYGTCWAHATYGSLEAWVKKSEGLTCDFSENNLANLHGYDDFKSKGFNRGGSGLMAAAYLLRWAGPILEEEDSYPRPGKSKPMSPTRHVQQVRWIPERTYYADTENLKRAVMAYGGIWVMYYHDDSSYHDDKNTYYFNANTMRPVNHAVTLVGWDDNFPRDAFKDTPPGDGAFIVKNSWGENWGESGCFYISYYDESFAWYTSYAFCNAESNKNYADIYQYDELGVVGSPIGYNKPVGWMANVFNAREDGQISAVGFYSLVPDTTYVIDIYTDCSVVSPMSGNHILTQQKGTVDFTGYETIPLASSVPIKKGQRFSVVIKLTTPGLNFPIAVEKAVDGDTSEASAIRGQSFVSHDGEEWTDLTDYDSTANCCIKAYTKSSNPTNPKLSSISIKLPDGKSASVKPGDEMQLKCEAAYVGAVPREVTSSAKWAIVEGKNFASVDAKGYFKVKNVTITVPTNVWVQATYTENKITVSDKFGFLLAAKAPDAPTGITATEGTDASCVRIGWNASKGATGYAVYRSTTSSSKNREFLPADGSDNVTSTTFCDKTATPGVDYWYFVNAKNSSGSSMDNVGVKGWRKLSPPDVEATKNLSNKVEVKWETSAGAKAYHVYRSDTLDGTKNPIGGWQTATKYQDTTAVAGRIYYYYVTAAVDTNGTRPSDYSIVADGMIVPPVTVSELTISGAATIESGKSAGYTASVEYSDQSPPKDVTASCNWSKLGSAADWNGSTKTLTAKTVTSDQKVKLIAFYTENKTTIVCTNEVTITPGTSPLTAPSGLKMTSQTTSGIGLSWNSVTGAGSYYVYRAANGEAAKKIGSANTTSFTDNTATPGVTYTYSVSAANSKGESARSSTVTGTVLLSAPTGVTATSDRTDGVNISWQPSAGATYYRVARATSKTGTKTELGTWTTNKSYLDTSATAGTTYYYFVRAATSSGGANASGYSDPAAQGMRIPSLGSLSSISIEGQDNVSSGQVALYTCAALYSNGESHTVKADTWSASPTTAATIDGNGKLAAKNVTKDTDVTVSASYTEGGVTKSATKTVKILASTSQAQVKDVTATSRWPFAAILDIDYTLVVNSSGGKAFVRVFGRDEDRGVDVAAKTLSGDGSDGSAIAAGTHRLSWDVGTDYPDYHGNALGVVLSATPYVAQTYTVTYSPGAYGTGAQKTATKTENVTLTLLGATFTRTGYTQTGWATSDGGAKVYDLSASYTANAPITLYPFWTRSYNLMPLRNLLTNIEKLNPDGVLSDDELNKAMNNPHYADLDGDSTTISSAEMSIFTRIQTLNQDKTLISNVIKGDYTGIPEATMEELQSLSDAVKELTSNGSYTVTYNPGANGTGSQQTATKTKDVALTLKGAIFTRTGYTQTGWATSDGGAKVYDLSASYTANASATLYPFWTRVYNLTPLRNLLTGIETLNPDGVLSDDELNKAMNNPHYADLDGNADAISSAEMSIFTRIQALNTDKTLLSNVMKGQYSDIPDATMEELGSISDAIAELTNNR